MIGASPLLGDDILRKNFESSTPDYNPWAGVTDKGLIAVLPGSQPVINDKGKVVESPFGPSVAVGDLNGDGLMDLVIGDSHGFFWYFPNSGTPTQPAFTHGEVMPIWLGLDPDDPSYLGHEEEGGVISKIQLVEFAQGSKRLDLVVGNYLGRLFYIPNVGSTSVPAFRMPRVRSDLIVPTRKKGVLWCNFLSPFLYDWYGTGNLDLIMGDGSYSANSIYLLKNQGSRTQPIFNEDGNTKIIPGMGREHLTPQVVDWNGDGKHDIIAGDRTGHINLFLNSSTDPKNPAFDAGQYVKLGAKDTFGQLVNVTVNDLAGNKLPNLIVTNAKGEILYSPNTGKPGAPQFGDPVPLHGVDPFPNILRPVGWRLHSPYGVPYELLVCTNATVEDGFTPPPNTPLKNALRFYISPIKNTYFNDFFYHTGTDEASDVHKIICETSFKLKEDTDYSVSFWIRSTGNIQNLSYHVWGGVGDVPLYLGKEVGSGEAWNLFEDTIRFHLEKAPTHNNVAGMVFELDFHGQGGIYLDDVRIHAADQP